MSVVKETNGLMTIPSNVDTLTAGEYSYVPSDVSKGHLTLALKKAGVTLGEKKLTMQALSPAQPILKLAIGTQGAASDDSATKLSWNVTDGEVYTLEVTVSGKVGCRLHDVVSFSGSGHAVVAITSAVAAGNNGQIADSGDA